MDPPQKSSKYYWSSVVFLVENELFKVPRHRFETQSEVFRNALRLPSGERRGDGRSDSNPMVLPVDVKKLDFERLVDVLYPTEESLETSQPKEYWLSVLRLSSKYIFRELRISAVKNLWSLLSFNPVERVMLAREYGVPDWLRVGYMELVLREEAIQVDEAKQIGWEESIRLCQIREEMRFLENQGRDDEEHSERLGERRCASPQDLARRIEAAFEEEIRDADSKGQILGSPKSHDGEEEHWQQLEDWTPPCPAADLSPIDLLSGD